MKSGAEAKRKRMSELIKQRIRRGFQTEQIEGRQYTYSLLRKKNKKFVLYNERLLLLKGVETIAYAAWGSYQLPFQNQHNLPNPKAQTSILNISNVDHKEQMLIIDFYPSAQLDKWEFSCSSGQIALNWKNIIQSAISSCKLIKNNHPIQINLPYSEEVQQEYKVNRPNFNNQSSSEKSSGLLAKTMSRGKLQVIHEQEEESQSKRSSIGGYFEVLKHAKSSPAFKGLLTNQEQLEKVQPNQSQQSFLKKSKQQQGLNESTSIVQLKRQQQNQTQRIVPLVQHSIPSLLVDTSSQRSTKSSHSRLPGWNWSYQFLKGENEQQIIEKFRIFSENCVKSIIQQLTAPIKSKIYTNISSNNSLQFQSDGVKFSFCTIWHEESSIFSGAKPIIETKKVKESQQQFKSANYLLQATKNKGKIRVPLMQIVEYKGFVVTAKAEGRCIPMIGSVPLTEVDFDQLEREAGISLAKIRENSSTKLGVADQGFYEDLARAENSYRRYEVCFLSNLQNLFPKDIYRQKQGRQQFLRPQVITQQPDPFSNSSMFSSGLRKQGSSRSLSHQSSAKSLQSQYTSIAQKMKNLNVEIQSLNYLFTNAHQLSGLLHKHGINIRYLGLAARECSQQWLKAILLADIAARASKYFIYLELEKKIIKGTDQTNIDPIQTVIAWINCCFGVGRSSDLRWTEISLQAEALFDYSVKREQIDLKFFLLSLQYHCRFTIKSNNKNDSNKQFFENQVSNIQEFSRQDFGQFITHSKIFDFSFTQFNKSLQYKLQRFNQKDQQQLKDIVLKKFCDPQTNTIQNQFIQKVILIILNILTPSQLSVLYSKVGHSVSLLNYEVQLSYFRATLRHNLPICDRIRDNILLQACKWNGESHPIMVKICNSLSSAYLHYTNNQTRAISYKLAALRLQLRLLGASHLRLAQTHYELAVIYYTYFKKEQSLMALKRSYQILKENKAEISQENLKVLLKLGELSLVTGSPKQAFILGKLAYSISKDMGNYNFLLESAELLGKSYECGQQWSEYIDFSCNLMPLLIFFKNSNDLQRVLKVILFPFFHRISFKNKQRKTLLLRYLSQLSCKPQQSSYQFLRAKIDYNSFPLKFVGYLAELDFLSQQIERGSILSRWKGFETIGIHTNSQQLDFLATLEALYSFLSGNFLEGIVEQSNY